MTNAQTYGPPEHVLDHLAIHLMRQLGGDRWEVSVSGYANTKRSRLFEVADVYTSDPMDPHEYLIAADTIRELVLDFLASRPNTQARAEFVAGGGLHDQLELF